jgi:hypothetical protein
MYHIRQKWGLRYSEGPKRIFSSWHDLVVTQKNVLSLWKGMHFITNRWDKFGH